MSDSQMSPNPIGSTGNTLAPLYSTYADDPDMAELIEMFVAELPERVGALKNAIANQDVDTLRRLSHQLKGAAGGYGFDAITDIARDVEQQVRACDDVAAVKRRVDDLVLLCRRAQAGSPGGDGPTAA